MQSQQSCDIKQLLAMPAITKYKIASSDNVYQKSWEINPDLSLRTITGSIDNNEYIGTCVVHYFFGIAQKKNNAQHMYKYVGNIITNSNEIIREGDGIEYYDNGDIFYGTFKNNHKHGPGKVFFKNMSLKYDGEWINDVLQGVIIGYLSDDNNVQYYFGQIQNDKPNGLGCLIQNGYFVQPGVWSENGCEQFLKFTQSGHLEFCSENHDEKIILEKYLTFVRDRSFEKLLLLKEYMVPYNANVVRIKEMSSILKNTLDSNVKYVGDVVMANGNYKYNGDGRYYLTKMMCEGKFNNNKIVEATIVNIQTDMIYLVGTFKQLKISALIKNDYNKMLKYLIKGEILCAFKCGSDNRKQDCLYVGTFLNGTFQQGTLTIMNSYKLYEGSFDTNVQVFTSYPDNIENPPYSGSGTEYYDENHVKYDGQWKNGKYHGEGSYFNAETFTIEYSGEFADGIRQGFGALFDPDGNIIWSGNFRDGDIS